MIYYDRIDVYEGTDMIVFTTGVFQTIAVIFNQMSPRDAMIQMSLHVMLPKVRIYVKSYDG